MLGGEKIEKVKSLYLEIVLGNHGEMEGREKEERALKVMSDIGFLARITKGRNKSLEVQKSLKVVFFIQH